MFGAALQRSSSIVKVSYSVSFLMARKIKTFSNVEIVKECLEGVVKEILPDKSKPFSNLSLSRQTVCRRINGISNEIILKLRAEFDISNIFAYHLTKPQAFQILFSWQCSFME
ncbi:zf-C2H2_12 domain-containing protein [Caerostris extrusa]|uniref:Zf-C2H2_12 domain-containing protein n=1 Tax=Caerostris extrusa TaxID=172846 RepID=A0AAV4SXB9_CAEEX|nr:zf-C2H2_12 domain-containing protein [Caerostris extrusa]